MPPSLGSPASSLASNHRKVTSSDRNHWAALMPAAPAPTMTQFATSRRSTRAGAGGFGVGSLIMAGSKRLVGGDKLAHHLGAQLPVTKTAARGRRHEHAFLLGAAHLHAHLARPAANQQALGLQASLENL